MQKVIIIRYSELFLKGKNKGYFERAFFTNIERALKGYAHTLRRPVGRYIVADFKEEETEKIMRALKKVFGAHTLAVGYETSSKADDIFEAAKRVCAASGTFKVEAHRGDKKYPLTSIEIAREIGGRLLSANPDLTVDVHTPECVVRVDIRENGEALVCGEEAEGAGGMPVGTGGKGLLLLSGGIDSPVAGHMMAKRGMKVDCLHFHSYPYTNEQAKEKVKDLAKILSAYTQGTKLSVVSVTHIQEAIHEKCAPELMITLLRRFMYRIAERRAKTIGAQCLITGESLGQVASQTIEGITSSNAVVTLPVLRPLIGFDKNEIIDRSVKMGAYETSILPFEDCCTVFLPDFPAIRPKLSFIEEEEKKLDVEGLVTEALSSTEIFSF
ncbi:MAG: tRNA uracil 4-sulfurtransferase ThiI [Candidatus Borkfalkiaceae bacterium]|nr:tRNA 4-thiouridine(8) synthase ThiI [Clostridia bacterium]MDY6222808.1 tRNA uracil 4-sulfurtransferase ThiI [Christensenellaceae bacterium]